jgi:proline iminopeptidase
MYSDKIFVMARLLCVLYILLISHSVKAGGDSAFYFTTSDSVRLYVRVAGNGSPCLFLHGGPGNTSNYFEALPVAKLMEQKMQLIYFDQRGGGRSASSKDSNYSIRRMEMDIEEIRNFLKIKKWSVIGHSFGGVIMTAYARDYPGNIRSLVYAHCMLDAKTALESHINNGIRLLKEVNDDFVVDKQLSPFNQMMSVHAELAKKGIEYKIMFRSQHEKDIDDSLISASTPHFNQDFQRFVWNMHEYMKIDYSVYTKDITCPVLVIAGKKDYAIGPDNYKSWKFPDMKLVLYDGGHDSFQEEPHWFADKVINFLDANNTQ